MKKKIRNKIIKEKINKKIGLNDLCSCGSQKKYRVCCLNRNNQNDEK